MGLHQLVIFEKTQKIAVFVWKGMLDLKISKYVSYILHSHQFQIWVKGHPKYSAPSASIMPHDMMGQMEPKGCLLNVMIATFMYKKAI